MSILNVLDATNEVTNPNGWAPLGTVIGLAIHHTVTTISPWATEAEERAHIRAIDRYHVSKGWYGFGYHYAVFPSARVYRCGWGQRAHVANRNHELIGVAFVGDLTNRSPSPFETASAGLAIADAWTRIGKEVPVKGHRDWVTDPAWATACPGRGVSAILEAVSVARKNMQKEDEMTDQERELLLRIATVLFGDKTGLDFTTVDQALAKARQLTAQDIIVLQGLAETQANLARHTHDASGKATWPGKVG
jgi:hypothetical protein